MTTGTNTVNALPTKDFFISTLVKDIDLKRSIIDLIDNSVDGAVRERPGTEASYEGLWIKVTANQNEFEIKDNCGGMSVDMARNYAFRFGRPTNSPDTPHSIGLFGVGMKRAIFKMGHEFWVESATKKDQFVLAEDIDEWLRKKDKNGQDIWEFDFEEFEENLAEPPANIGTTIKISDLRNSISEDFESDIFIKDLANEIAEAHMYSIQRGLRIELNGVVIKSTPVQLFSSEEIKPAFLEKVIHDGKVKITIHAGVYEPDPKSAGWYIFCNGRLILGADRSFVTGWGGISGKSVPNYHNDYAMFRGYVFYESDASELLPWNTTKTGVDTDSLSFRAIRNDLIVMMKPVLSFLRNLRNEKSDKELDDRILENAVESAHAIPLREVLKESTFVYPTPNKTRRSRSPYRVIQYKKHIDQILKVQKQLGVTTLREVGELTFEYYIDLECEE